MNSVTKMWTVGEIARSLDVAIHRVEYVIRTRKITPVGWAGHARVFTNNEVKLISIALSGINTLRESGVAK